VNLVSIVCITYNQEAYISEAIESFIMQKTSFPYEIIIGEDCSIDSTRRICEEYSKRFPESIKLITSEKNVGYIENFRRTILAAKGQYIALCEGDDYWTDPFKLQKQVDYLISNPDYALVHTCKEIKLEDKTYPDKSEIITCGDVFEEILVSNNICALTILVKTDILKNSLDKVIHNAIKRKWMSLDYVFWLDIATEHKIGYINETTGVHRILHGSISHPSSKSKSYAFEKSIIEIKEFFYAMYMKRNPAQGVIFKNKFKENIFHCKKRLILDYGLKASNELVFLLTVNPFFYFYLFYKKGQRLFCKYFNHE